MSLKAKIEAIIYAAEEPISLADITALVKDMVLAEEAAEAARTGATEPTEEIPAEPVGEQESSPEPAESVEPDATAEVPVPEPAKKRREKKEPTEDQRVKGKVREIIDALIAEYDAADRGMEIRQVAGGYRMSTKPEHHDVVRAFAKSLKPPVRLSLAALETLAVIAYKQPVTVPEISEIRGVESAGVIGTLLDRKLITTAGRKQVIGRPILYKTTKEFLLRFGLDNVSELPSMEEFEKIASDGQGELFTPQSPPEAAPAATESAPIEGSGEPATLEPGAEAANAGVPVAEQASEGVAPTTESPMTSE
ncbi:MAG: SMC-Scp complex subunit ScpB [Terriglobia bacterium]|nr:SMC-Scp complex subunit ScpB [Terriglobia bacterium]